MPIPGVPFDDGWAVIPNAEGRVLKERDGDVVPGQYVVGWAKRGPTGLIGTNSPDSKATVAAMLEDVANTTAPALAADDASRIVTLLDEHSVRYVTYEDWQRLDNFEVERGQEKGKVRDKLSSVEEMLDIVEKLRS